MVECVTENCDNAARGPSGLCPTCNRRSLYGGKPRSANVAEMGVCAVSHCSLVAISRSEGALCQPHYQIAYRGIDPHERVIRANTPGVGKRLYDVKCWVSECPKRASTKSLCNYHYKRAQRGLLAVPSDFGVERNPPCSFEGCVQLQESRKSGLCHSHNDQLKRAGKLSPLRDYGKYVKGKHVCAVGKCRKPAMSLSLCQTHSSHRSKYGIDTDRLVELMAVEKCENTGCNNTVRLNIDHDHETGVVRGMLCNGCNSALGMLGEDVERMHGLARYKMRHS